MYVACCNIYFEDRHTAYIAYNTVMRICFILWGSDDCVTFEPVDSTLCVEISYTVLQEQVWAPS
jgi:hypothetical protein